MSALFCPPPRAYAALSHGCSHGVIAKAIRAPVACLTLVVCQVQAHDAQAQAQAHDPQGPAWKFSLSLSHFEGYEGVSRRAFRNTFEDHHPRGQQQNHFAESEARLAADHHAWRIELFARQDALIRTNRDTTDLYAALEQSRPAETGRQYTIDFDAQFLQRRGLGAGVQWMGAEAGSLFAHPQLSLYTGVRVWDVARFREGAFQGSALTQDANSVQFNASGFDRNSRAQFEFPERPGAFAGIGAGLNIRLGWQWNATHRTVLHMDDVVNTNRLRHLPVANHNLTSEVQSQDGNGNLQVRAALVTQRSYADTRVSLKPRLLLTHQMQWSHVQLHAGLQTVGYFAMPLVAVYWNPPTDGAATMAPNAEGERLDADGYNPSRVRWGIQSNLYYRSIGPVMRWKGLTASLQTDRLRHSERSAIGGSVVWVTGF